MLYRKLLRFLSFCVFIFLGTSLYAGKREYLWPKGKMPDAQEGQIAAMTDESCAPDFNASKHRQPYIEWMDSPENPNGGCMILISGGAYNSTCDVEYVRQWNERFTELGFQCVNLVYRTPRPEGLPIYQSAWQDGQRAVRLIRRQAEKRGIDPERIGTVSMSAGSHLAVLLASNSQTAAYGRIDSADDLPCHINWAVVFAPAYVTSDAENGTPATRDGYGNDVTVSRVFNFDEKTCPMSLHHGGKDPYSPNGSTLLYRELRKRGIPAEVHLYPNAGHMALGLERGIEFMRQMGFAGSLEPEVFIMDRFSYDNGGESKMEAVWPEGKIPDMQEHQCIPYLEWHFPKELKTTAIQIIYSGGSYTGNGTDGFEVLPARKYINELGMTVVTMKYRTPRPVNGLAKHTTAWQDLQRAIRVVRSEAPAYGLDPDRIGIMGSSAGGHLTLMGVTSSMHGSYLPVDEIDKLPCNVQWGIAIYPAYALTDGADEHNTGGGNGDSAVLVPEFSFDLNTCPMLMIHGDSDPWAAMNSVKVWEKMRSMGIQCELHTLALRQHCFQRLASPGTGSYTWLDRIGDYLTASGILPEKR